MKAIKKLRLLSCIIAISTIVVGMESRLTIENIHNFSGFKNKKLAKEVKTLFHNILETHCVYTNELWPQNKKSMSKELGEYLEKFVCCTFTQKNLPFIVDEKGACWVPYKKTKLLKNDHNTDPDYMMLCANVTNALNNTKNLVDWYRTYLDEKRNSILPASLCLFIAQKCTDLNNAYLQERDRAYEFAQKQQQLIGHKRNLSKSQDNLTAITQSTNTLVELPDELPTTLIHANSAPTITRQHSSSMPSYFSPTSYTQAHNLANQNRHNTYQQNLTSLHQLSPFDDNYQETPPHKNTNNPFLQENEQSTDYPNNPFESFQISPKNNTEKEKTLAELFDFSQNVL